jgi:hypothetical protein
MDKLMSGVEPLSDEHFKQVMRRLISEYLIAQQEASFNPDEPLTPYDDALGEPAGADQMGNARELCAAQLRALHAVLERGACSHAPHASEGSLNFSADSAECRGIDQQAADHSLTSLSAFSHFSAKDAGGESLSDRGSQLSNMSTGSCPVIATMRPPAFETPTDEGKQGDST